VTPAKKARLEATRDSRNAARREHWRTNEKRRADNLAWQRANPERRAMHSKTYKTKDREAYLQRKREDYARSRARRYGKTVEELDEMLLAQRGRCAICDVVLGRGGRGPTSMTLDHDHTTGEPRAWLCTCCNRGIGYLREDPEIMKNAIDYVTKPRQLRLIRGDK
jgi:hypothetical protein